MLLCSYVILTKSQNTYIIIIKIMITIKLKTTLTKQSWFQIGLTRLTVISEFIKKLITIPSSFLITTSELITLF